MGPTSDPPPRGFVVTAADGGLVIRYRTRGMGGLAVFFAVWLGIWTFGCVSFTIDGLSDLNGVGWILLLFVAPFWVIEFGAVAYVAWFFGSVTRLSFGPDELVAERSLWRFRRCRVFRHGEVTAVRQVKDGGEEDSFPTWALAVIGPAEVRLLSRQPIDKSNWLGPIVAKWAGVAFEPWEPAGARKYEAL